jgi:flagellin-like hook-associated protein FlgL
MALVGMRLDLAQAALSQLDSVRQDVKSTVLRSTYQPNANGQTADQQKAVSLLDQMLSALNTRAGDRYLFSGRSVDQPAVETLDAILNGDGMRAGLKQIIDERRQADLGASGLGRLVIPAAVGTTVAISEDVDGSPFGFKLAAVSSTIPGAILSGPVGSPPAITIDLAVNAMAGNSVTISLNLPDGSTENVVLTATNSASPGAGQFTIGATAAATAANLQAALTLATGALAETSLVAASAMAAADDFFNFDAANPPRRVAGPPYNAATAYVGGTSADTVLWYSGEAGSEPARSTAVARIDQAMSVSYGLRGNEQAIRSALAGVAVFAAMSFSAADPESESAFYALTQRLGTSLGEPAGAQQIATIAVDLANAQVALEAAADRHLNTKNTLSDMLQEIEGISPEEVGAKILALQTRLQASLQTTAMLYELSLVNYI